MTDTKFSGHETFHCRHFWLKKGYDYTLDKGTFSGNDGVLGLGVGKNMVASIHFWLKSFGLKDPKEDSVTPFGDALFGNKGHDPFLEDPGSLWLLQYHLVNESFSSIYRIVFSDFRRNRISPEFTKSQLEHFIEKNYGDVNRNTLDADIKVFLKSYVMPTRNNKSSLEDDFSALFLDLKLVEKMENVFSETKEQFYKLNITEKKELPAQILLYAILNSFENEVSIPHEQIQSMASDHFLINAEGLESKINEIIELYPLAFSYKEDAGRKEFQIKNKKIDKWKVLSDYYGN